MSNDKLDIPAPRPDRPPLHSNAFDVAQGSNTQLKPLFPYLHPGAMVPASALLIGGPDADYGHFFHHNTQHEIVLTLAANGAMLTTGQLFVGALIHGVNSFLKNEKDPEGIRHFCDYPSAVRIGRANGGLQSAVRKVPRTDFLQGIRCYAAARFNRG